MRTRRAVAAATLCAGLTATIVAAVSPALLPPAWAQDAYKALAKRYQILSKNHDNEANRERRYVLLDLHPFRTEKPCRKLLKEAFDDEKTIDNRVAVVHVLGGSGNPKSLDFLVKEFKKENARAPVIALGAGLGYTPDDPEAREAMTKQVVKHLRRSKDDLRLSLIQGLGEIGHASAVPALLDLSKMTTDEWFTRNVALGRAGGEAVVPMLQDDASQPLPAVRLGATLGLAATASDVGFAAVAEMLADSDERVVRAAAAGLLHAGRKEAAPALATALGNSISLRTREELRRALETLLGRDLGYDAAAWKKLADGGSPPQPKALPEAPRFFGLPVASDSFALLIDTSRSTGWMERLARIREECLVFVDALPEKTSFALARASRAFMPYQEEGFVGDAQREDAKVWIDELRPGGGFDMRLALTETLTRYPQVDTIVIATDSHPWGSGRSSGSRETMEIFRRLNATRRVKLVIALVMPGGRYESSERSESEIEERIDYLTEMAEDSGGAFVHVDE